LGLISNPVLFGLKAAPSRVGLYGQSPHFDPLRPPSTPFDPLRPFDWLRAQDRLRLAQGSGAQGRLYSAQAYAG